MLLRAIIAIIRDEHTVVHNWMTISERSLRLCRLPGARGREWRWIASSLRYHAVRLDSTHSWQAATMLQEFLGVDLPLWI